MMGVGLVFSYSRGAWAGTAVGLLYLAKAHGKLNWRYVMTGFGLLALGILLFWGRTADTDQWYPQTSSGFQPSIGAAPGVRVARRVANDAGSSVWRRLEQGGWRV